MRANTVHTAFKVHMIAQLENGMRYVFFIPGCMTERSGISH